ncbi:MAG: TlyA family rRNA (cytidine-2'-O)-methyltransferase [Spirochaetales bacterium]|nr:TlyA family rRNA (cytidine-2'-O)-methyltransferase [Spirochaetales bacterium]
MAKKYTLIKLLGTKYKHKTKDEILAHILCGEVRVNNEKCLDPKTIVNADSVFTIEKSRVFVSRGGEKLNNVLNEWSIDVSGKTLIDAGCSTGGFTDCLLKRGASLVYAVDVGFNQLAYSLRESPHVRIMEKTNITHLNKELFPVSPDAAVMDLSFRSVRGAAAHLLRLLKEKWIIALIKPQFEWQNPVDEFNGIIRDKSRYSSILISLLEDLADENAYVTKMAVSALKGRKGNSEFFFFLEGNKKNNLDTMKNEISLLIEKL